MTYRAAWLLVLLFGCSNEPAKSPDDATSPPSTGGDEPVASPDAPPPDQPVASPEPAGTGDEPTQPEPAGRVECAKEIALTCKAGLKDGCLMPHAKDKKLQLTSHHVCVPEKEKGTVGCEKEIARQCPKGQIDACLMKPAVADTHICVEETP